MTDTAIAQAPADLFERAARLKLRFETTLGNLSAEDLWTLPLVSGTRGPAVPALNELAQELHLALQAATVTFVATAPAPDPKLQLRFDLVKRVIDVRQAEQVAAAEAAEKAKMKGRIREILASKREAALEGKSEEELQQLLTSL